MGTPYSAFITLIVTAGVFNILMAFYAYFSKSKFSGARTFAAIGLLSAIYTFGSALELGSGSLAEIKLWIKFEYLGMPFIPPLNLVLVMQYLGMDKYVKRNMRIALFAIPAVTVLLVMTNDAHHLYYRAIELRPDTLTPKADVVAGAWYIIQGAYNCACMMGSVVLLLRHWNRMKSVYRRQLITMLTCVLLPMAGDFLYLGGLTPDGMDPVPVLMSVTSGLYLWALTSGGLFNVAPIARDNLFESMSDGVLVLDMDDKVVDYNKAAASIIPELDANAVGRQLDVYWNSHADEPLSLPNQTASQGDSLTLGEQEVRWHVGGRSLVYLIRSSVVHKRSGQEAGKLIIMIDVTERRQLQDQLRHLAYYDGLTHIFNRRHFIHLGEALLKETGGGGDKFSLMLFDIDHFKRVNDTFGHEVGDQALQHVVQICLRVLRPEDVFARYGGEEFVVAMPSLTLREAGAVSHRIRSELAAHPLLIAGKGELRITASFGVVQASSQRDNLELLLRQADEALYQSKRGGRDAVHLAGTGGIRAL